MLLCMTHVKDKFTQFLANTKLSCWNNWNWYPMLHVLRKTQFGNNYNIFLWECTKNIEIGLQKALAQYTWIRPSHDWLVLLSISPFAAQSQGNMVKRTNKLCGMKKCDLGKIFIIKLQKCMFLPQAFLFLFARIISVQHLCCLLWNGFSDPHLKKLRHKSVVKLAMDFSFIISVQNLCFWSPPEKAQTQKCC